MTDKKELQSIHRYYKDCEHGFSTPYGYYAIPIMGSSTKWWKSVSKYPWVAINKRMKFGDGKGASPFQSAIIYLGKDLDRFNKVFGKYGTLYIPYKND